MEIVHDAAGLHTFVWAWPWRRPDGKAWPRAAARATRARPFWWNQFLRDAIEVDVDVVADGQDVVIGGVMEHIEEAGIHSGDSACCLPPSLALAQDRAISATQTMLKRACGAAAHELYGAAKSRGSANCAFILYPVPAHGFSHRGLPGPAPESDDGAPARMGKEKGAGSRLNRPSDASLLDVLQSHRR